MDEESLKEVDPNLLSDRNGKLNPNTSTALFNAMIYPMIGHYYARDDMVSGGVQPEGTANICGAHGTNGEELARAVGAW